MALPTGNDLLTLNYSSDGKPFAYVVLSNLQSGSLDYSFKGKPFFGVNVTGGSPPPVTYNATQFMVMF